MDAGDACDVFAWVWCGEFDAAGVASGGADLVDVGADDFAAGHDDHDLVGFLDEACAGEFSGAFGDFGGADAEAAASLGSVFVDVCSFGEACFEHDEECGVVVVVGEGVHGEEVVVVAEFDACDA